MATKEIVEHHFAWRDVAADDRDWLRRRTEDVETFCYRTACDLVRIGLALSEVRKRLKYKFRPWLLAETPLTRPHAYRLMAIAKVFAAYVSDVDTFAPSALYILAQEKTPQAARDHAVQLAESGQKVTRTLALEILDAHREVPTGERDVEKYEKARHRVYRDEERQDRKTAALEEQDLGIAAGIGLTVRALVEEVSALMVSKIEDGENDPIYSVTTTTDAGGPRNVWDRDLARALSRAAGVIEYKFCPGCCVPGGDVLGAGRHGPVRPAQVPTNWFGNDKRQSDLLMVQCGHCERARKKERRELEKAASGYEKGAK